MASGYPLFVRRDLDGFFGLFIDNLVQLLLIVALCAGLCGMTGDSARFIYACILPGAAVSILLGNLFYAWQAHRVARALHKDISQIAEEAVDSSIDELGGFTPALDIRSMQHEQLRSRLFIS